MKKYYLTALASFLLAGMSASAQCNGVKGPNMLGAKGTFSVPAITVNNNAAACTRSGSNTYNPVGNVGKALNGCSSNPGAMKPCSDYTYTSASGGLGPEGRYSILKTIGDANGGNCIKGDWRGQDHTGDGGYFMAVNGAPNSSTSPVFYKIKSIPVCLGATYEFSAWVINLLPGTSPAAIPGSEPNISFRVNGVVIANSGPIAYHTNTTWVKVGGSFVATSDTVDLEVINATAVASGNDLGIDDISFNLCGSNIAVAEPLPANFCEGSTISVGFTVTDATASNSWYQWQKSTNGGSSFVNEGSPAQATFNGSTYVLTKHISQLAASMNGFKYRLVVATSEAGLENPDCCFYNEFTLVVPACGPLPVTLTSFNGKYNNGLSTLDWTTSQEVNSDRFELMRSFNGTDFVKVATIETGNNSAVAKQYQYVDRINGQGYVYYRLAQIDQDGKKTLSNIIRLSMGSKAGNFEVYPNPFTNNFTATFSADKANVADLKIANMNGQIVYKAKINVTKGSNAVQMRNIPSIPSGLYYITIQNDDLEYRTKVQKL